MIEANASGSAGGTVVRRWIACVSLLLSCAGGCSAGPEIDLSPPGPMQAGLAAHHSTERLAVRLAAFQEEAPGDAERVAPLAVIEEPIEEGRQLAHLERLARGANPKLRRLSQELAAAEARIGHLGKLPDPTVAANLFVHPIETAAGSQRANVSLTQRVPWLARLDAQSRQAYFESLAWDQAYRAGQLEVIADVRRLWYRLYLLQKRIEISRANQQLLNALIEAASGRVATAQASVADVRLGTLAASRLEEEILMHEQRLAATQADLNRAVGRAAEHPIAIPTRLDISLPDWSHPMLRQLAWEQQPEIVAAELRTQATSWGVEVARLQRRPDVSLNASWFAIDDNRPPSPVVDVGGDAWSVGAQVSLPLWHHKNDALENEATWRHSASHANVDELRQRYDAALLDLWGTATTAWQTATLYRQTLLPQAREALTIDQQSYANGKVDFRRLLEDVRNLLMIELGYHQAVSELAIAVAKIQRAVGTDLVVPTVTVAPLPE